MTYEEAKAFLAGCNQYVGEFTLEPLKELSDVIARFESSLRALEDCASRLQWTPEEEHLLSSAQACLHSVIPAMETLRGWADKLETMVADDLWPLPSYQEMLFMK